jgi:uncharacterized membrane protein
VNVIVAAGAGVSVAAIVLALVDVALSYQSLPAIVPFRFDLSGQPSSTGPRWLFVVTTAVSLGGAGVGVFALLVTVRNTTAITILAGAICFIAYVQHLMLQAAQTEDMRLPMNRFWPALLALLAAGFLPALFGRR